METVTLNQYMFLGILTISVFSLYFNFFLFYKWHRSIVSQELQGRRNSQRIAQLEASILEGDYESDRWKSNKSIQENYFPRIKEEV
jgi:hypothetical protein|tara:strand:+ start:301 stop:558 length:258 start_codon:yes stop_codon:yes gene_type:complete